MDQFMGKFGTSSPRTITRYTNTANNITTNLRTPSYRGFNQLAVTIHQHRAPRSHQFVSGFSKPRPTSRAFRRRIRFDAIGLTGVFQHMRIFSEPGPDQHDGLFQRWRSGQCLPSSNQPMWDYSDSLNIIRGNTPYGGRELRRWRLNRDLANNFLGVFGYTGLATATP